MFSTFMLFFVAAMCYLLDAHLDCDNWCSRDSPTLPRISLFLGKRILSIGHNSNSLKSSGVFEQTAYSLETGHMCI